MKAQTQCRGNLVNAVNGKATADEPGAALARGRPQQTPDARTSVALTRRCRVWFAADRTQALRPESEAYVSLQRPWYATAVAWAGEVWSPVCSTRLPMITLALAQRNEAGEWLGVYGAPTRSG